MADPSKPAAGVTSADWLLKIAALELTKFLVTEFELSYQGKVTKIDYKRRWPY